MTNDSQETKAERFYLLWLDDKCGRKYPAGVAFHDEKYGEYRLKIDALSDEKAYYLRPISSQDGTTIFRVEVVIKKNGRFSHRSEIGTGKSSKETNNDIYMDIGPFDRKLILVYSKYE